MWGFFGMSKAFGAKTWIIIAIVAISLFVCVISQCSSSSPIDRDEFCDDMLRAYRSSSSRGDTDKALYFLDAMRKAGCN